MNKKFSKVIEILKRNQTKCLEVKNSISWVKIIVESLNNGLDWSAERLSELEDRSLKISQSGKKKRKKRMNTAAEAFGISLNEQIFKLWKSPRKKEEWLHRKSTKWNESWKLSQSRERYGHPSKGTLEDPK